MNSSRGALLRPEYAEVARRLCHETRWARGDCASAAPPASVQAVAAYAALYLQTAEDAETTRPRALPVSTLVKQYHIDVFEFFRGLPAALDALKPKLQMMLNREIDREIEAAANTWRTGFVYSAMLAKKYKDLFTLLFNVNANDLMTNKVFRFGWLMFIVEKARVAPETSSLSNRFHLLLCLCNFLLVNTPRSLWHPGLRGSLILETSHSQSGTFFLHNLARLHRIPRSEWKELDELMTVVEREIFDVLNSRIDIQKHALHQARTMRQDGSENVLDPERHLLDSCLDVLNAKYTECLKSAGDCDERLFLEEGILDKIRESSTAGHTDTTPPRCLIRHSNAGSSIPATVSSPAVVTVSLEDWFATFGQQHPPQPSELLQSYLHASGGDIESTIRSMLITSAQKLFPADHSDAQEMSQEALLGIKLFYLALERLLEKEVQQRGDKNLSALFRSQGFLLAVMACCFEIVVEAFQKEQLTLSTLLHLLHLKPFELCKLLDVFVRVMWDLPPRVKAHLYNIEERIIESLAWQPGSSLYSLILETAQNETDGTSHNGEETLQFPFFSNSNQPIPGLSLDQRSPTSAFKVVATTSSRTEMDGGQSCGYQESEKLPDALGPMCTVHAKSKRSRVLLEAFFKKVLKLSAFRLLDFKSQLNFHPLKSSTIMLQVYKVLKCTLYEQTSLFYHRHLDQILLCVLYWVCKVNRLPIRFNQIVHCYKEQPHHDPETYRSVILRHTNPGLQAEDVSDIIDFYNTVFITKIQSYIIKCCASDESETASDTMTMTRMEGTYERDSEPFPCEALVPWLISDTANLTCLLKRGRDFGSKFSTRQSSYQGDSTPGGLQLFQSTQGRHNIRDVIPCTRDDASRSSGINDDAHEGVADIEEHVSKRPRR